MLRYWKNWHVLLFDPAIGADKHMKKYFFRLAAFLIVFSLLSTIPTNAFANSAEPPCFTVIVSRAPEDLELSVEYPNGNSYELVYLYNRSKSGPSETHAWESYYEFLHNGYEPKMDLREAVLGVSYGSESYTCAFPEECSRYYNGLLVLNLKNRTLRMEASTGRSLLLVILRITLTLLIEGLFFFLFGYRKKASWLLFLITNLVTQIGLNLLLMLAANLAIGYMALLYMLYLIGEGLVFLIEILVFVCGLRERTKARAALCALAANAASLALGGLILTFLPLAFL